MTELLQFEHNIKLSKSNKNVIAIIVRYFTQKTIKMIMYMYIILFEINIVYASVYACLMIQTRACTCTCNYLRMQY